MQTAEMDAIVKVYEGMINRINELTDSFAEMNPIIPIGLTIAYVIAKGLDGVAGQIRGASLR